MWSRLGRSPRFGARMLRRGCAWPSFVSGWRGFARRGPETPRLGRVVASWGGGECLVEDILPNGKRTGPVYRCKNYRSRDAFPVTGDYCIYEADANQMMEQVTSDSARSDDPLSVLDDWDFDDSHDPTEKVRGSGMIHQFLERHSVFLQWKPRNRDKFRHTGKGFLDAVERCSNVDRIGIVIAPVPAPSWEVVDNLILASHTLGVAPYLILNKIDLLANDTELRGQLVDWLDQNPVDLPHEIEDLPAENTDSEPAVHEDDTPGTDDGPQPGSVLADAIAEDTVPDDWVYDPSLSEAGNLRRLRKARMRARRSRHSSVEKALQKTDISQVLSMLEYYQDLGYEVVMTSATSDPPVGLETLRDVLGSPGIGRHKSKAGTTLFMGQSGAGKSSLLNVLSPDVHREVKELDARTMHGAHTTSNTILYHLPAFEDPEDGSMRDGGDLIDCPGVREVFPVVPGEEYIQLGYMDLHVWATGESREQQDPNVDLEGMCVTHRGGCSEGENCLHYGNNHDMCAVMQAVEAGLIPKSRYASYAKLIAVLRMRQRPAEQSKDEDVLVHTHRATTANRRRKHSAKQRRNRHKLAEREDIMRHYDKQVRQMEQERENEVMAEKQRVAEEEEQDYWYSRTQREMTEGQGPTRSEHYFSHDMSRHDRDM